MIYIEKNQSNKIAVTLSEKTTILTPFYLFVFTLEQNEEIKYYFTAPDISGYPLRINIFELVEGSNGNEESANGFTPLGLGESHLNMKRGQYKYVVYESEVETLDPEETTGNIIESSRMVVEITTDEDDRGQNNNTINIYE